MFRRYCDLVTGGTGGKCSNFGCNLEKDVSECTGLIAQPIVAVHNLLFSTSDCNKKPQICITIGAIGESSSTYFICGTTLLITFMSVERWLHMTQRSLVTSRRGGIVVAMILLMPSPFAALHALEAIKSTPALVTYRASNTITDFY